MQKADAGLELAAVRSNAGQRVLVAAGRTRGIGMLQWIGSGAPGNSGQTSRTRSQRLITWSKRWPANSARCLERRPGCRCRARASPAPRSGAAAWDGCPRWPRSPRRRTAARSSASAICERALLPVHRNSTRAAARRAATGGGRGVARARVQRDAGAGQQLAAARQIEHVVAVAAVGCAAAHRDEAAVAQPAQVVGDQALPPAPSSAQLAHAPIAAQRARSAAATATDPPPIGETAAASHRRVLVAAITPRTIHQTRLM